MTNIGTTIHAVARLAGTSSGTVSRVLNNRPGVAPATRQRVLDAIETLHFVPDPTARALSLGAPEVALALPSSADGSPYYGLLRRALFQAAEQFNLRALEVDEQEMEKTRADAVICVRDELSEQALDTLEARGRAVVVIGRHARTSWVCVDDASGMADVTRLLIRAGHQGIVHLGSETPLVMPQARLQGYRQAMSESGLLGVLLSIQEGGFMIGAYRAVTRAWSRGQRFTALACLCDEAALGAMLALRDLGVRVPEDVSVVGFDGLPHLGVPLTTVRQDFQAIARTALEVVRDNVHVRQRREVVLGTTLVQGQTNAAVR